MKKIYKLFSAVSLLTIASGTALRAQEDVSELIKSSPADATKLATAYLTPLFKGFGTGLTQGWYNTARNKGTGRFDLRISASAAIIPTSARTYDVTQLGLSNRVSVKSGGNIAQTVGGDEISGPTLAIKDGNGYELESFALPQGTGISYVPAPQLQATLGLPKGIDVSLRYVPSIKLGDDIGKVEMIGGGIKLNILQFLTKGDKILPFNLAIAAGYTQIKYELGLDVPPPSPTEATPATPSDVKDFNTQKISAQFSGTNIDAILSKKLLFLTPYVSVGYSTGKTDVGLKGNYPIISGGTLTGVTPSGPVIAKTYSTFTDPISIKRTDISGVRASVGFQMSLLVLKVYGSYNLGEYNSVNAGIGFGF